MKNSFNIGLVEVEGCTFLKNPICDNIFWPPWCAFTKFPYTSFTNL